MNIFQAAVEFGLSSEQAKMVVSDGHLKAVKLGVSFDKTLGHKNILGGSFWGFSNDSQKSLDFIENRPNGVTADQAMDQIMGLNKYQIEAIEFGLPIEQVQKLINKEHLDVLKLGVSLKSIFKYQRFYDSSFWPVFCNPEPEKALDFIKNRPNGVTADQAMDEIMGFNEYQIEAVEFGLSGEQAKMVVSDEHLKAVKLGVSFDKTLEHKSSNGDSLWNSTYNSKKSLEFIENRPDKVTADQAMDQIMGLEKDQIEAVDNLIKRAMEELGLSYQRVFHEPMTEDRLKQFEAEMPFLNAGKEGAVDGFVYEVTKNNNSCTSLPQDITQGVAQFLTIADGDKVAASSKEAARERRESYAKRIENDRLSQSLEEMEI